MAESDIPEVEKGHPDFPDRFPCDTRPTKGDLLSDEEVKALLEAGEEAGSNADVIQELVTEALVAKLILHRSWVRRGGYITVKDWRKSYNSFADGFKSLLDRTIDESVMGFSDRDKERFTEMSIITLGSLCLCSVEELSKAGFTDLEIESILLKLNRLELFLMG